MSNLNHNLFHPGASPAREHTAQLPVPAGLGLDAFWRQAPMQRRAHLQRSGELERALCGERLSTETDLHRTVPSATACTACLTKATPAASRRKGD